MSRYLIDRIMATPNIELMIHTEIARLEGSDRGLERVHWRNRRTGIETAGDVSNVFLFIGADPATDWLAGCGVELDRTGFVVTGAQCEEGSRCGAGDVGAGVFASVTYGPVRSSAWAGRSAKVRRWWPRCMDFSATNRCRLSSLRTVETCKALIEGP